MLGALFENLLDLFVGQFQSAFVNINPDNTFGYAYVALNFILQIFAGFFGEAPDTTNGGFF